MDEMARNCGVLTPGNFVDMGSIEVFAADNGFGNITYGHDVGAGQDKLFLQLFA